MNQPLSSQSPASTPARAATYTVTLLVLVYMFNIIDRNIVYILLDPIKAELNLSDTQLGFVTGIVFAFFYSTMGIPIAMWADRGNRRNILVVTLLLYGVMTIACGFAVSFAHLLVARMLIALGNAGTSPAAHSIIADVVPPERRASARGTYFMAANLGQLVLFLVGGWVSQLYGWRTALYVVGAPAVLLAALVWFTMREPARGGATSTPASSTDAGHSFGEVVRHLWSRRSFRHLIAGCAVSAIGSYAIVIWFPTFLKRSFGMSPGEVGTYMALCTGVLGALGTFASGRIADVLARRDLRWNLWLVAIVSLLVFPCCVAMYLAGSKTATLLLFLFPSLAFTFNLAPCFALAQSLARGRMRAQTSALMLFTLTIVGQGIGPQLTGLLSDRLQPMAGIHSLRQALLVMTIFWLWAAVHFVLAARPLREDVAWVARTESR